MLNAKIEDSESSIAKSIQRSYLSKSEDIVFKYDFVKSLEEYLEKIFWVFEIKMYLNIKSNYFLGQITLRIKSTSKIKLHISTRT